MSQADADDVLHEPGGFRVLLRVPCGITAHILRMPSAEDVIEHRRGFARVLDLPYNKQELTVNLAAAGSLYQKLVQTTQGYAGAVPIIHQAVAIKAAIATHWRPVSRRIERQIFRWRGLTRAPFPVLLGSLELAAGGGMRSEALPGLA